MPRREPLVQHRDIFNEFLARRPKVSAPAHIHGAGGGRLHAVHVARDSGQPRIIQVTVQAEVCAPAISLDGIPDEHGRSIRRLPAEQRSVGRTHAGHDHIRRVGLAQDLRVLAGEAWDVPKMRHLRIDSEDLPRIALAQYHVSHQGLAARQILVNRRPLGRDLNAALLHQPLERLEFRGAAMAVHKIGDEIVIFQEKAKVRVPLRQPNRLCDDAVAAAQAFLLRAGPIKVEMGKWNDVNFMSCGGNLLGS